MQGYRTRSDSACATIAPAVKPPNIDTEVDINEFHCSFGHSHKELLLETAKHRGITLRASCKRAKDARWQRDAGSQWPRPLKTVQISVVAVSFSMFTGPRVYDQWWEKSTCFWSKIFFPANLRCKSPYEIWYMVELRRVRSPS